MGTQAVWCVAFCLLAVSLLDARISQTESLVVKKGSSAKLQCEQTDGHNYMFWYRQDPGQGLQLVLYFYDKQERERGNIPARFKGDKSGTNVFHLNIDTVEPQDSAVYFCASSLDTVSQRHLLPGQKPPPI
ncbi:hypothetical protein Y1Q_0015255 [Alligator mississippiensis]|uniref:Ig-like domain-containing protein n=1 Tax=Alligator mississippiensis TaxID=8496 RepID=A0A151NLH6_ALLMI|nr:hypothetical protein Y1Q_0015255 [Alligator mississippiensis]